MPDFFAFTQGTETNRTSDASPLLGRFRAVPQRRNSHGAGAGAGWRGSVHVGYGALLARELEDEADQDSSGREDDSSDDVGDAGARRFLRRRMRRLRHLWVSPKSGAVKRAVDRWWNRWLLLVVLPAMLVCTSTWLMVRARGSVPRG